MALTPERINELKEQAVSAWREAGFEPMLQVFVARAIEAEVHKQDTELIRQMRDALTAPVEGGALHALHMAAIAAANARLEGT